MIPRLREEPGPPRPAGLRSHWRFMAVLASLAIGPALRADEPTPLEARSSSRYAAAPVPPAAAPASASGSADRAAATARPARPSAVEPAAGLPAWLGDDTGRTVRTVALFGLVSLAPIALLMITAFVRINIVLTLLRQALGSPQVPGNQVLTALALLLTALVMWPIGETVSREAIAPYAARRLDAATAWDAGSRPIKAFMVEQLERTRHEGYVDALYEYAVPPGAGPSRAAAPGRLEDFPLRVLAPAFLLSELTTALMMGFYLYLPFLVVDLVVSAVLAATGLFMLPPTLVATPVKLILFVLADGWMLVATMLLSSFGAAVGPR